MSPASHSGLIYYSDTLKYLLRREKNIIFPHKEKENTPECYLWARQESKTGSYQCWAYRERADSIHNAPSHTLKGLMESLQVSVTHEREQQWKHHRIGELAGPSETTRLPLILSTALRRRAQSHRDNPWQHNLNVAFLTPNPCVILKEWETLTPGKHSKKAQKTSSFLPGPWGDLVQNHGLI